jgi:uncharacterized Rossmann fold enzyme
MLKINQRDLPAGDEILDCGNIMELSSQASKLPFEAKRFDKKKMRLNTTQEEILANVALNIKRPLPQMHLYPQRPQHEVAIVGGGWSTQDTIEELRGLFLDGKAIIAVNGAANYLVENGIRPHMHMVLDAKPENIAFVEKPIPDCKYFLAGQVHPSLFEACEDRNLTIYHILTFQEIERAMLISYYGDNFRIVPGGSTVGLRAISLVHMLGFRLIHLFGFDSCYAPDGRHHAYEQKWNDGEGVTDMYAELKPSGRTEVVKKFRCSSWQAHQTEQFFNFLKANGDQFKLEVHGEGLLAIMMRTGTKLHLQNVKEI